MRKLTHECQDWEQSIIKLPTKRTFSFVVNNPDNILDNTSAGIMATQFIGLKSTRLGLSGDI